MTSEAREKHQHGGATKAHRRHHLSAKKDKATKKAGGKMRTLRRTVSRKSLELMNGGRRLKDDLAPWMKTIWVKLRLNTRRKMPDIGPRRPDGAFARLPKTYEGGASPSQYVSSMTMAARVGRRAATRRAGSGARFDTNAAAPVSSARSASRAIVLRPARGRTVHGLRSDAVSSWGGSSGRLEARRGLRRLRGLVERREACGCIAEASEAVRSAEAPPKKTARSSICHPNHLINKTDFQGLFCFNKLGKLEELLGFTRANSSLHQSPPVLGNAYA